MRIPQEKIEEIKNTVSIVDFISNYVALKKSGKSYKGLCPFHNEKTPSFMVNDDKQIFHCFGCHKGGDVFKFLMEYKKISYIEAVEEVAAYAGISIKPQSGIDKSRQDELETLYEINHQAAKFFADKLYNSIEGEAARNYLSERKIKVATQKAFGLGYAPDSWSALKNHLENEKLNIDKALELGLLDRKERGTLYDKFRDRIIFPIFSTNGRVVGFGGRILTPNSKAPKYLNSQESKIYSKRKILYGLYHAKEEIRKLDRAILVEGYMDLITLYQAGIKNVVASSGTSLTDEQVQLLSRFTKNVIVLFDADAAGQSAAMRSIELLLKYDFEIRMLSLPEGEDPDSFINNYGAEEFREELNRAVNFLEFQLLQLKKEGMLDDPAKQADAIRQLVKTAALINDELRRNLHIQTLAKKFNLREKMLERELEKFLNEKEQKERREKLATISQPRELESRKAEKNSPQNLTFEKTVIQLLFEGKESILDLLFDNIPIEDLQGTEYREIAQSVFDNYKEGIITPSTLIENLPTEQHKELVRELLLDETTISRKWDEISHTAKLERDPFQEAEDLVRKYKLKTLVKLIAELKEKISKVEDANELRKLLEEVNELQKEKKILTMEIENND